MKTKLLVFFILLIACLPKGIQANNSIQQYHAKQDTASMKKYQTFDEFTMRGIGTAKASPFVYVKEMGDSIYVVSSCPKDSARLYVKIDDNLWYSHMEYDMHKKGEAGYHCKECRIARTYDRYFYNDTIADMETGYMKWKGYRSIYVRTKNQSQILKLYKDVDSTHYSNISNLRQYIFEQCKTGDVYGFRFQETDDSYTYLGGGDIYYQFQKKAYGLWGTLPGVEETYLYMGIDIREYSDHLKDFQKKNPDFIFKYSDKLPSFPNGTMAFIKFVKEKIKRSLFVKHEDNDCVTIEAVIEKDGSITNPVIVEGIDQLHDEDAMNIVRQMPKWIPAQLNGSPIRYSEKIHIYYDKSYYSRRYR